MVLKNAPEAPKPNGGKELFLSLFVLVFSINDSFYFIDQYSRPLRRPKNVEGSSYDDLVNNKLGNIKEE